MRTLVLRLPAGILALVAGAPLAAAAPNPESMANFDGRPVAVAVAQVRITRTLQALGGKTLTADAASQFVWVWAVLKNFGPQPTASIYPDSDITLQAPGGLVANSRCSADEYRLPPGGTAAEWLVFLVPKKPEYVLVLNVAGKEVQKKIIPVEWRSRQAFPSPPDRLECS